MKVRIAIVALLAMILLNPLVGANGVGTIRIEPPLPVESPASTTFTIDVQPSADPTNDPHILLVMTKAC